MGSLARTTLYVALFVAVIWTLAPDPGAASFAGLLPPHMGILQVTGAAVAIVGFATSLWCAVIFGLVGHGTPLPFDPPRRLVLAGPYRFVRNPMALGIAVGVVGLALVFESVALIAFAGMFLVVIHGMVTLYEEPTLRETFGADYVAYCERVNRWVPRRPGDIQGDPGGSSP